MAALHFIAGREGSSFKCTHMNCTVNCAAVTHDNFYLRYTQSVLWNSDRKKSSLYTSVLLFMRYKMVNNLLTYYLCC